MNPSNPAPTPVPLRDIAGPVDFFPYPVWMVAAAVVALLALVALLVWFFAFRRRPRRVESPESRALAALGRLRAQLETTDPYAFSITVSDLLREYVRDAHGLSAPTQTSREFLDTVRARQTFSAAENDALAAFLDRADLIKFARLHATSTDSAALLEQAERLVRARPAEAGEAAKP